MRHAHRSHAPKCAKRRPTRRLYRQTLCGVRGRRGHTLFAQAIAPLYIQPPKAVALSRRRQRVRAALDRPIGNVRDGEPLSGGFDWWRLGRILLDQGCYSPLERNTPDHTCGGVWPTEQEAARRRLVALQKSSKAGNVASQGRVSVIRRILDLYGPYLDGGVTPWESLYVRRPR